MRARDLAWMVLAAAMTASCVGNSGDSNHNSSGSFCVREAARLRSCGLATEGTDTGCDEPRDAQEACHLDCYLNAPCSELEVAVCDQQVTDGLVACAAACQETQSAFACGGGETVPEYFKCDGLGDCSNGADEVGCPTFDCGNGEMIRSSDHCNGSAQCSNAADEAGCTSGVFTCDNGETLSAAQQCDGNVGCSDASDEAGCPPALELICN